MRDKTKPNEGRGKNQAGRRTNLFLKEQKKMEPPAEALNMLEEDYPETSQDIAYAASFFMLDVSARSWQAVGKKQCL